MTIGKQPRPDGRIRIGVDLGGTKTEIIAIDDEGVTLYSKRVPSPRDDYSATIDNLLTLINNCEQKLGSAGSIGIGTPGAISIVDGQLKNSNSTWLNGRKLKEDLQKRLGRSISIANDANCFTLSEAIDGAAANYEVVFGVIIGTGTGGGLVVHKQLIEGRNRIAGEWGHNPLPWREIDELPGPQCYCGQHGCIETYLSGPGMAARFKEQNGYALAPPEILARARNSDTDCKQAIEKYYENLAKGLAHIINVVDPSAIVLGGGLSNIEELYQEIPRRWAKYVFSDVVETALLKAVFGDASGVRGAAWL